MLQGIANIGLYNRFSLGISIDNRKSLYCLLPLTFLLSFIFITTFSFAFSSLFDIAAVNALTNNESYVFFKKWGSQGTADGQFVSPTGIAINPANNNIYVVDSGNNRIQEFDNNGTFLTQWGSIGSGDMQFNKPTGIAVDSNTGNVYVVDSGNNRIQKFDSSGNFITKWNVNGTKDITNNRLPDIAVNPSGEV